MTWWSRCRTSCVGLQRKYTFGFPALSTPVSIWVGFWGAVGSYTTSLDPPPDFQVTAVCDKEGTRGKETMIKRENDLAAFRPLEAAFAASSSACRSLRLRAV